MANPLTFAPHPVDPHLELDNRLAMAPREHAEAMLVIYDILQAAHENGTLDAVHGLVAARDTIFGRLAQLAKTPEGKAGLLNLLEATKIVASLDTGLLDHWHRAMLESVGQQQQEIVPPSLFQLLRRTTTEDGRRGLSFFTLLLTNLGKSLKR